MATIRREGEYNLQDLYKIYIREGGILSYNKYKEVVSSFMKKLIEKIIKTGYEFSMPYHCGLIKVIQLERKYSITERGTVRGAIDWGESNKLKAEIIERGEIPLVNHRDEDNNITGNNGGVEWLCYHTSTTYFSWIWTAHISMKNCLRYTFDITQTNSRKLSSSISDNSYLLFKLRKNNGTNKDYLDKIFASANAV